MLLTFVVSGHRVVTYSTVENFEFQTWKDFSDLRLIEPSRDYPVIEVGRLC